MLKQLIEIMQMGKKKKKHIINFLKHMYKYLYYAINSNKM